MNELPILKLEKNAIIPSRAHPNDAGLDLYALEDQFVEAGRSILARTGVAVAIEDGHVGLVCDRSSLAKRGLKTAGGVIDAGYRGELGVILWNISREPQHIKAGERLAQLLILPISTPAPRQVDALQDSLRGAGGFGSTGR